MNQVNHHYSNEQVNYRVVLVDDSRVIRKFLQNCLEKHSDVEIVATAENGLEAIEAVKTHQPDVVLLDVEMPQMDGIKALPKLLQVSTNLTVIMISTLTKANAATSMIAMELGASDYMEKPTSKTNLEEFEKELLEKIKALVQSKKGVRKQAQHTPQEAAHPLPINDIKTVPASSVKPEILAVGSSTGGPQALVDFFTGLNGALNHMPIFLTQHMPPNFTLFLAERLNKIPNTSCVECEDGQMVKSGVIHLAPGDYHMVIEKKAMGNIIRLNQDPMENFCRPAVDVMLRSLMSAYGNRILTVILTGMGQDGLTSCKALVESGGRLVAQDKKTSVVWGMPGAVAEAGICEKVLPLHELAPHVTSLFKERVQ